MNHNIYSLYNIEYNRMITNIIIYFLIGICWASALKVIIDAEGSKWKSTTEKVCVLGMSVFAWPLLSAFILLYCLFKKDISKFRNSI